MIARDLTDQRTILIRQEDHADLSSQFASHWGNERVAAPARYESVVTAAAFHDTHFRDIEIDLPIDREQGRPYGHRNLPFAPHHLDALRQNIAWLKRRDRYAALLVSMHHTGLLQNRYGVINSWQNDYGKSPKVRPLRPEVAATVSDLEKDQRTEIKYLEEHASQSEDEIRRNYRLMQVFDLLSLYLCCDGYGDGGEMKQVTLGPISAADAPGQELTLNVVPTGADRLRFDPYPFDCDQLQVSVSARVANRLAGCSEADCRAEYLRAPRERLSWTITN
jgi:hypothetical protein